MYKKMKRKKVEKKKLSKGRYAYLIFRYFPDLCVSQFLVCVNYNFKNNIYENGLIFKTLDEAYIIFNHLCINGSFDYDVATANNEGDLDDSNSDS